MSTETITTIVGVVSLLLVLAGGFGWMIHRMDTRMDKLDLGLRQEIGEVKQDVSAVKDDVAVLKGDVSGLKSDVAEVKQDVASLKGEMTEVKVAVARLEGPTRPPLLVSR